MTEIWKLSGARQASFGIPTGEENWFLTLKESFGEVDLSTEYGVGVTQVGVVPDSATDEELWTASAYFEKWTSTTYRGQVAARAADAAYDAEIS